MFSLVRRSANVVTHSLARALGSMSDPFVWKSTVLEFLMPVFEG